MRNCELNVFTVFGRFSGSLRTSIEIEAFLADGTAAAASSVFAFLGILPSLSRVDKPPAPPITLLNVSLSLSACDTLSFSLRDAVEEEEEGDFEEEEWEEEEDLCELLFSLSLSRLLPLLLPLELLFDEEEDEEVEEEEDL